MAKKLFCDRCKSEIPEYDKRNVFTRILTRKKYDVDISRRRYELCEKCHNELVKFMKSNGKEVDAYGDCMEEDE